MLPQKDRLERLSRQKNRPMAELIREETAGSLKRKYGKSRGLLLPDAIIAATAIAHDLDLVTGNVKHFRFQEVRLAR